jgi:hypothetical protein
VLLNNRDWKFRLEEAAAEVVGTLELKKIDKRLRALKSVMINVLVKLFLEEEPTPKDKRKSCRRFLQRGEQVRASARPVNDLPQIRHFFIAIFVWIFLRNFKLWQSTSNPGAHTQLKSF